MIKIFSIKEIIQASTDILNSQKLEKTNNHVTQSHKIYLKNKILNVNSFHRFKIKKLNNNFKILGIHEDKSIEYAISDKFKILCI